LRLRAYKCGSAIATHPPCVLHLDAIDEIVCQDYRCLAGRITIIRCHSIHSGAHGPFTFKQFQMSLASGAASNEMSWLIVTGDKCSRPNLHLLDIPSVIYTPFIPYV
jgi:hypothetical protein